MSGPRRIVCLTEETCEWLYLLGEEKRIVGISAYTVRPARAAREKPKVSAFLTGNVKKVRALKPDLVIGFSDIQADLAQKLIKEGLNVLITNQRSIEDIFATLQMVAALIGKENLGNRFIRTWRQKLQKIAKRTAGKRRKRVFFQEWDEPVISAIRWVSELIEICGGRNIFATHTGALATERIVTLDTVAKARPEVIVGSWCGKPVDFDWLKTRPELQETPAIQQGKIAEMDSSVILQPGPALFLEGVDRLYDAIHMN